MIKLQAIGGVGTEYPANSVTAFLAAAEQLYDSIYLDVELTKYRQWIVYDEDFGSDMLPKFTGTLIADLQEVLILARENGLIVRIGTSHEWFSKYNQSSLYRQIEPFGDIVSLTCRSVEALEETLFRFPKMHMNYNGEVNEVTLTRLSELLPPDRLTVWLPDDEKLPELAPMVKQYANLGVEGLTRYERLDAIEDLGADIASTYGQLKPIQNEGTIADMHTHSQNSMDANVPVVDLCRGEIQAGVKIMAVTDHCELDWCEEEPEKDIYSCFKDALEEIREARELIGDECDILMGIELGQGLWYPSIAKKLLNLLDYDVVIGSVHMIKDPTMENTAESSKGFYKLDYSKTSEKELLMLMDHYFDEVLEMVNTTDMDILAHLFVPFGYPRVRVGWIIDKHQFEEKIKKILQRVIDRGIALELNCGEYLTSGDIDPELWVAKLYYQMGGYLITLGSDSHSASYPMKCGFQKLAKELRQIGFRNIFYYKNRRSYPCSLSNEP